MSTGTRTVIRGGLVITAADEIHADVLIEGGRIAALAAPGTPGRRGLDRRAGSSTPPGSTSSRAASTPTPTWRCRSAAPSPPTPSRPAPGPPPGAAPPPSSTSPSRASAASPARRPRRLARQGRGQLRDRLRLPHDRLRRQRGHAQGDGPAGGGGRHLLQACSWPTPASSTATTARSCAPCSAPPSNGGLIMMHAENGIAIDVLVEQALARGETDPRYHGEVRKALLEAEATHRAIKLAQVAGRPALRRPRLRRGGGRRTGPRARRGPERLRRDLPAVPLPVHRQPRRARLRGRQVRVLHTAAAQGAPGQALAGAAHQRPPGGLHRPLPLLLRRARRSSAGATSRRSPTACRASRTGWTCSTRPSSTGTSAAAAGSRSPAPPRPGCSASTRKKGTIAPGADADVVIYDPHAEQIVSAETHHMNVDYSAYEGRRLTGRVETSFARRTRHHRAGVHRTRRSRRLHPALHLPVPQTRSSAHGLRTRPADRPAGLAGRRADEARRGQRLHPRLDLRLRRALAGTVRDLQSDPGQHQPVDGRTDGHQPRHPHLGGHRLHLRHPQRHVRQPHRLRHRPRRLRDARGGPRPEHPGPDQRGHEGHPGARLGAGRPTSAARSSGSPGSRRTRTSRSGWPPTAPRR